MKKRIAIKLSQQEPLPYLISEDFMVEKIFPYAIDSLSTALEIMCLSKVFEAASRTRAFWVPFLRKVMKARREWLIENGASEAAEILFECYTFWPSHFPSDKARLQSKFLFEDFPPAFPFAHLVRPHEEHLYSIREDTFEASAAVLSKNGSFYLRESAPSFCYNSRYLQKKCIYTKNGLEQCCLRGRDVKRVNAQGVTMYGKRSVAQGEDDEEVFDWSRQDEWVFYGSNFLLEAKFVRAPWCDISERNAATESIGSGYLKVEGETFSLTQIINLDSNSDDKATKIALKTRRGRLLVLSLKEGIVRSMTSKEERRFKKRIKDCNLLKRPKKRVKTTKQQLVLFDMDYEKHDVATFIALEPEGSITCTAIWKKYGRAGVDAVVSICATKNVPVEVDEILAEDVGENGEPIFHIHWLGYPKVYNTWEPKENLGVDGPILIEDFRK